MKRRRSPVAPRRHLKSGLGYKKHPVPDLPKEEPKVETKQAEPERKIDYGKRGGWRPGAGRPKGTTAKINKDKQLDKYINKVINDWGKTHPDEELTSLAVMQAIYKNPNIPSTIRQRTAQIALPYEFPKYQAKEPAPIGGSGEEYNATNIRDELESKLIEAVAIESGKDVSKRLN